MAFDLYMFDGNPSYRSTEEHPTEKTDYVRMGFVIQTKHLDPKQRKLIVIDGGYTADELFLSWFINTVCETNHVDAWILSHQHNDHAGALYDTLDRTVEGRHSRTEGDPPAPTLTVGVIYANILPEDWLSDIENETEYPGQPIWPTPTTRTIGRDLPRLAERCKIAIHTVDAGPLHIPGVTGLSCEVLSERISTQDEARSLNKAGSNLVNDASMVLRIVARGRAFLFLGDLGPLGGRRILNSDRRHLLKTDWLQLAHHGNWGVTKQFYEYTQAKYFLWPTPPSVWAGTDIRVPEFWKLSEGQDSQEGHSRSVKIWINEIATANGTEHDWAKYVAGRKELYWTKIDIDWS